MLKLAIYKGINGFSYALAINVIIAAVIIGVSGKVPVVPDYAAMFPNETSALLVELVLIGLTSASLAAGTVIMEMEKLSLVAQSIIYFVFSSAVWGSVGCFCWRLYKYTPALISVGCSYLVSYALCWIIQYKLTRKQIGEINAKLAQVEE